MIILVNFAELISDSTTRNYITICLPTSSGDIMTVIGGSTTAALDGLTDALDGMDSFDGADQIS